MVFLNLIRNDLFPFLKFINSALNLNSCIHFVAEVIKASPISCSRNDGRVKTAPVIFWL